MHNRNKRQKTDKRRDSISNKDKAQLDSSFDAMLHFY